MVFGGPGACEASYAYYRYCLPGLLELASGVCMDGAAKKAAIRAFVGRRPSSLDALRSRWPHHGSTWFPQNDIPLERVQREKETGEPHHGFREDYCGRTRFWP